MLKYSRRIERSRISRNKIEPIFQPTLSPLGSHPPPPFDKLIYSCHQASISRVTIRWRGFSAYKILDGSPPFRFVATIGRVISEDTVNKVFISAWRPVNGAGKLSSRNSVRNSARHFPRTLPFPLFVFLCFFIFFADRDQSDRSRIVTGARENCFDEINLLIYCYYFILEILLPIILNLLHTRR